MRWLGRRPGERACAPRPSAPARSPCAWGHRSCAGCGGCRASNPASQSRRGSCGRRRRRRRQIRRAWRPKEPASPPELPGPAAGRDDRRSLRRGPGRALSGRRSPPTSSPACAGRGATAPFFRARQRRLHVAAIHRQERPVNRARRLSDLQTLLVKPLEDARPFPLPKAPLGSGRGAERGGIQRPPGAARAHHEPDRFHGPTLGHERTSTAGMRRRLRQSWLHHRPEPVGKSPSVHGQALRSLRYPNARRVVMVGSENGSTLR